MNEYLLCIDGKKKFQDEGDLSFIGGHPRIPTTVKIPECSLCGADQTFFFQISFPDNHNWNAISMALFACMSCMDLEMDYVIPEMLNPPLYQIDIPENFLEHYQNNFKIVLFNTIDGELRLDYKPKVKYKKVNFSKKESLCDNIFGKIGGEPSWYLEDESPASYDSNIPMIFLLQVMEDFVFEILPDAPKQVVVGLSGNLEDLPTDYYILFNANYLYFFGTKQPSKPLVYIITQQAC